VLRHQDVSGYDELIPEAELFQFAFKNFVATGAREQRGPLVTTERDEVKASGFLEPD